jgi:hypothetical protein
MRLKLPAASRREPSILKEVIVILIARSGFVVPAGKSGTMKLSFKVDI